jgi:hypothetical protein
MTSDARPSGVEWAARRTQADPFFLGSCLAEYQTAHAINEDGLAAFLACDAKALVRLALCRTPQSTSLSFRTDIARIAAFTSCAPDRLAQLVREIAAMRALRSLEEQAQETTLLAARDSGRLHPRQPLSSGPREIVDLPPKKPE